MLPILSRRSARTAPHAAILGRVTILVASSLVPLVMISLGTLVPNEAEAQPTPADPALYVLAPRASYEVGCYGPCDCAIRSTPLIGTFQLRRIDENPLFKEYAVEKFDAIMANGDEWVPVRGQGRYRIGGEVALTHQIVLDLVIGDRPAQTFDSGVVPGGSEFPAIHIDAPAHGYACVDTVVGVDAKPITSDVPGMPLLGPVIAAPNPFRESTELRLALAVDSPVDAIVVDGQGRRVRSLARQARLGVGFQTLVWDGQSEDGARMRPGMYFVRVRVAGHEWVRPIVRLE